MVMFRLPDADEYTVLSSEQSPAELTSVGSLKGKSGFVLAPFSPSSACPILLFPMDEIRKLPFPEEKSCESWQLSSGNEEEERKAYARDFRLFHQQLVEGNFEKVVLARVKKLNATTDISAESLFFCACRLYPSLFVSLVSSDKCGTWLTATPEILLQGDADNWKTIALAGTMRASSVMEWSEKNKHEQRLVAQYVAHCLADSATHVEQSLPHTARAAELVHIRTDFAFQLQHAEDVASLVGSLHPTPAVCGLPKGKTLKFILDNESVDRKYYSGFSGIYCVKDTTRLFVTLRCMELFGRSCHLYAGGGLLKESTEASEWQETEDKASTMKRCFDGG